jgi:hypothetical protein
VSAPTKSSTLMLCVLISILGTEQILPPLTACPRAGCGGAHLSDSRKVEARLYTLRRGVLPVYSVSMYCRRKSQKYVRSKHVLNYTKQIALPAIIMIIRYSMLTNQTLSVSITGTLHSSSTLLSIRLWSAHCAFISRCRWPSHSGSSWYYGIVIINMKF